MGRENKSLTCAPGSELQLGGSRSKKGEDKYSIVVAGNSRIRIFRIVVYMCALGVDENRKIKTANKCNKRGYEKAGHATTAQVLVGR